MNELLAELLAAKEVREEDDKRIRQASSPISWLTGEVEALDGALVIGDQYRVRLGSAVRDDLLTAQALKHRNFEQIKKALEQDDAKIAEILPYMEDETTTVQQARQAYEAANQNKY